MTMHQCQQFMSMADRPPANFTPLRASGHLFAAAAGYAGCAVKMVESKAAHAAGAFAYDVFVREPGATRGKKIGSMIERALEAFGPYSYN
jgi:hypothetical protein